MSNMYYVSAYATSPSFDQWNPVVESQYFYELAKKPEIVGIEHPYFLQSEKYSMNWLKDNIPNHWSITLTTLPTFMTLAKNNPFLGLASTQEKERNLAVEVMHKCSDYVRSLNQLFGRNIVRAVHFHSLPGSDRHTIRGNKLAFKKSLYDIQALNWSGAQLNLEHCDAYMPNQTPEKGCLLLEEEIELLTEIRGFGLILNWGRSAIENRSVLGPLSHIHMAKASNLLKGFFFSGCTDIPDSHYGAWKDTHMPPNHVVSNRHLIQESLLGQDEISKTFALLERDHYLGVKVLNPSQKKTLEKSIGLNFDTIDALEFVSKKMNLMDQRGDT